VLLVDNASTNGVSEVLRERAAANDAVDLIVKDTNQMLYKSRRDGVEYALSRGAQYITFVDSDDWVEPNYISALVQNCVENDVAISYAAYTQFDENDVTPIDWHENVSSMTIEVNDETIRDIFQSVHGLDEIGFGNHMPVWGGVYRADLFDGVDWRLNNVRVNEDTRLQTQLILECYKRNLKVSNTNLLLLHYRQNFGSSVNSPEPERQVETIEHVFSDLVAYPQMLDRFHLSFDAEVLYDMLFLLFWAVNRWIDLGVFTPEARHAFDSTLRSVLNSTTRPESADEGATSEACGNINKKLLAGAPRRLKLLLLLHRFGWGVYCTMRRVLK
jgi:glycosyltransferase involved in cell wall biosynthesis